MKTKLTLIILGLILSFCSVDAQNVKHSKQFKKTEWLNGTWYGIGFQPNEIESAFWTIALKYDYSAKKISISYPSLNCGGYWKLESANSNKAVFVEYLGYGLTRCVNESKVVITKIDDEFITVSFFNPGIIKGVVSYSTLEKVK